VAPETDATKEELFHWLSDRVRGQSTRRTQATSRGLYLRVWPVVGWPSTRLSALRAGGVRQARGENPARTPLNYIEGKKRQNLTEKMKVFLYGMEGSIAA